ncbi:AAA family ATPase, partial [Klebsiella pneumoniae]|nr:AAA family ATPase [Klebsiella pneumoniae]
TPVGIGMAPVRDGDVVSPDEFAKLPQAEQARLKAAIDEQETGLAALLAKMPAWEREQRREVQELNEEVVRRAVDHLIDEVRADFQDLPA